MARITCDFFSEALQCSTSMTVFLPQPNSQIGVASKIKQQKQPTLYLLHGLSDDHTIWSRFTSIERYASALGWAVVMPAAGRSFYTDMEHGYDFYTYVSEELPTLAQSFFPLSDKKEENFIAGLSMGGYGAFKVALRNPEKFAAAASMSGSLDINERLPAFPRDFNYIFGNRPILGSDDDLYHLVSNIKGPGPKLYQCCGTEDHNYEANIRFRDHCLNAGLDLTYEEGPGGHDWGYWDKHIQPVLKFFEKQL
ncbi:alpha/beta hydrolase [Sutcliffiella rhizosphaerae]|uniref:S-formylglutathione hydrolase FrmB n=1 Tax=Sutcliffiella rhizosphaerae TaxID=2880967 RepID=A0ABM8YLI3_9BACI|nr:alpha/beta hydrolase family protein [Sutcliffiella rhizosphaerae]CAG9620779.1 hypothetical protein BACCIP111883_01550 [Sutcliffiella rhizosphaerae]